MPSSNYSCQFAEPGMTLEQLKGQLLIAFNLISWYPACTDSKVHLTLDRRNNLTSTEPVPSDSKTSFREIYYRSTKQTLAFTEPPACRELAVHAFYSKSQKECHACVDSSSVAQAISSNSACCKGGPSCGGQLISRSLRIKPVDEPFHAYKRSLASDNTVSQLK